MNEFDQAVENADLEDLMRRYYPFLEGGRGRYNVPWRPGSNSGALSIFDGYKWKDHVTGESGTAYHFLTKIVGLDPIDAWVELGISAEKFDQVQEPKSRPAQTAPRPKPPVEFKQPGPEAVAELSQGYKAMLADGLPSTAQNRGLTKDHAEVLLLGRKGEGTLIPFYSFDGELVGIKMRQPGEPRYRWVGEGYRNPIWTSPGASQCPILLIFEGEFKAMTAWAAVIEAGISDIGVLGMPGADANIDNRYLPALTNKEVYIIPDQGEAGEKGANKWSTQLTEGQVLHHMCPPTKDICDYAHKVGLALTWAKIKQLMEQGRRGYASEGERHLIRHIQKNLGPKQFADGPSNKGRWNRMAVVRVLLGQIVTGNRDSVIKGSRFGEWHVEISNLRLMLLTGILCPKTLGRARQWLAEQGLVKYVTRERYITVYTISNYQLLNFSRSEKELIPGGDSRNSVQDAVFSLVRDVNHPNQDIPINIGIVGQYVFNWLRGKKGTLEELADYMGVASSTVSRTITKLNALGLLTGTKVAGLVGDKFASYHDLVRTVVNSRLTAMWAAREKGATA